MIKVVLSAHVHICFSLTFNPVNCTPWADSCQGRVLITAQISKQYYRTIKSSCLLDCKSMPKHHPCDIWQRSKFLSTENPDKAHKLAMNPNPWCLHSPRSSDLGNPGISQTPRGTHIQLTAGTREEGEFLKNYALPKSKQISNTKWVNWIETPSKADMENSSGITKTDLKA